MYNKLGLAALGGAILLGMSAPVKICADIASKQQ